MGMKKMTPNTDADYYNDGEGLAKLLLEEMRDYAIEQKSYDINDSFYDYLAGLISARQTVVGRLGYYDYIQEYLPDWTDC
jgi:hypothetical protein